MADKPKPAGGKPKPKGGAPAEPKPSRTLEILFWVLIDLSFQSSHLTKQAKETLKPIEHFSTDSNAVTAPMGAPNPRWQNVQNHIQSGSPGDWRLAIIEADIILEEMLKKMGYQGAGIGDMLKNVEKSDFTTLDQAWRAHKVRNNIAHDGGAYTLSHEEARRVIGLYQQVFEEFYYI